MAALILTVGNTVPDTAVAQAKKETKTGKDAKDVKDKKDAKDKKDSKAGVIEITQGKDEKYRFFVRDGEGKLLAMSGPGGFATMKEAEAAIDHLKDIVAKAKVNVVDK